MKQHWHVGYNMPGCLPDSLVECYDTPESAWQAWQDDLTSAIESIDDDDLYLTIDTERNLITVTDVTNGVDMTVESYVYWCEPVDCDCETHG